MKITRLVILFNYKKIVLGILLSLILLVISYQVDLGKLLKLILQILSVVIILNIFASIIASYILYDKSDLYKLNNLKSIINFNNVKDVILIHASFDPLSIEIEKKFQNLNLTVCDIFENRHEHENGIKISKKVFPPNPREIKIVPNKLPFEDQSQDVILAITALHEILDENQRVDFFKEAKRILKKNGLIVVSEQFRDPTNFIFFNIGAFHFLSFNTWKKSIAASGLEIIKNEKITPFANMLILKNIS